MSMTVEDDGGQKTTVQIIDGRGRALVASTPLRAGEVVLKDSPILLYSALPLNPHLQHQQEGRNRRGGGYCSHCFRILLDPSCVVSCPFCSSSTTGGGVDHAAAAVVLFCGPTCRSAALDSSHTSWVCQSLSRLQDFPSLLHHHIEELQIQARFLVAAYNLCRVSPSDFQTLLCLQGDSPSQPDAATVFLHSLISSLCPPPPTHNGGLNFTLGLTAELLAKDKLNAFGLMEPFGNGERSVRAYGIYPKASFFNHDCLPNGCRFDYLDVNGSGSNTHIVVRLIHDVPLGREICLSYFPVNLNYSERQQRLKEDYGFTCNCDRCNVEANWSDSEEEEAMDEGNDDLMVDSDSGVKEEENDFPHAYFFLKYMCSRENCWGTLAPLPPSSNGTLSSVMECNICGNMRKNDDEGGIDIGNAFEKE